MNRRLLIIVGLLLLGGAGLARWFDEQGIEP
jgi:hypothetical protein